MNSIKRKLEEQVIKSDSVFSVHTNDCCHGVDEMTLVFMGLKLFLQNDAGAVTESQNKRLQNCMWLALYL